MTTDLTELENYLDTHPEARYVDCLMVDVCGNMRGKRYPRDEIAKVFSSGMQICYSVYLLDALGESLDPVGRGFTDGDPDGSAFPIPGTLVPVPWAKHPGGQVLLSFREESPVGIADPRNVLKRVLERYDEDGLSPMVALELEFYLTDLEKDPRGAPVLPTPPGKATHLTDSIGVYSISDLEVYADFVADIEDTAQAQKIDATVVTKEYSAGQFEVNLRHNASALAAADQAALLRWMISNIALKHGYRATFMSKPFPDLTGSGMHMHFSMMDKNGKNIFDDGKDNPQGSEKLGHAIGGLQAGMAESMAFCAPNRNAMRRFAANLFTPVNRSWGVNNRSVAFRIPTGDGKSRRIEHRIAGAEANPYLVSAAVLASAHYGMKHKIDPGPEWTGNASETMADDIPFEIHKALETLRTASILRDYFTPEYVEAYRECKQLELEKFWASINPVEYDFYL